MNSGEEIDYGFGHNKIEVIGSPKMKHPTGIWKCDTGILERGLNGRYQFETHQDIKVMKTQCQAMRKERE